MAEPFSISFLPQVDQQTSIEALSDLLDGVARQPVAHAPWADGTAVPKVDFAIAHNAEAILLKYYVQEKEIKAQYHKLNDPVYEDSCVEFFIAFNDEAAYYNLEFNCAGTARVQYGPGKHDRVFIPDHLLERIRFHISIRNKSEAGICWELTLLLPKETFKFHPNLVLEQTPARVNFFKCGDRLPRPHFLCWSNIIADSPEFHLPAFFKDAIFKSRALTEENTNAVPSWTAITNKY